MHLWDLLYSKIQSAWRLISHHGLKSLPYIVYYSFKRWILSYPLAIYFLSTRADKSFVFNNNTLAYFYHHYNMTWNNSRAIEIPIAMYYVNKYNKKKILEVGNVLSHYFNVTHDVIDKYEKAAGVKNVDIEEIDTQKKFDLIISISTMEHVGQDEIPQDPEKSVRAVKKLKKMVNKKGTLLLTLPFGHNQALDKERTKLFNKFTYFRSVGMDWAEISEKEISNLDTTPRFGVPYKFVYIAEFINS